MVDWYDWGGKRKRAGRPKKKRSRVTVYLSMDNLKWLDAHRKGQSRSDALDMVLAEARAQMKLV